MDRIGCIGVGKMGSAIAQRLLAKGLSVIVYDQAQISVDSLVAAGAIGANSCLEVFRNADIVIACLPSVEASLAVAAKIGEAGAERRVRTYVETSTIGPTPCRAIAREMQAQGILMVDAPVSGGPRGAGGGRLTSMVASSPEAWLSAEATVAAYSDTLFQVGHEAGLAQVCKLVNNAISLSSLAIACEATAYGTHAGLDLATLIDVINASSGRCDATVKKFPQSIVTRRFDYGASMETARKDLALFVAEAQSLGSPLRSTPAIAELWRSAAARGRERDFTELYTDFEMLVKPEREEVNA